jgi:sugar lactone lactonase YvrE
MQAWRVCLGMNVALLRRKHDACRAGALGARVAAMALILVGGLGATLAPMAARQAGSVEITGGTNPLNGPTGIALDADGTLYVVEGGKDQIRLLDADGNEAGAWGASGDGPGEFRFGGPENDFSYGDVAVAPDGDVFVTDPGNNRVQKLGPDGAFLLAWGEPGDGEGQFTDPTGIAVDAQGHVYVADYGNARIEVFDGEGKFLDSWDGNGEGQGEFGGPLYGPNDVAIDPDGYAWVTDDQNNRIYRFSPDGALVGGYGVRGEAADHFWVPWGIAIDASGNVYVAEEHNNRVHMLGPDGATRGVLGARGTEPGQFSRPLYVAVEGEGALYVSDYENNRVQVFREPLASLATPTA